ncbi:MAG: hypothetical protein CM15mP22_1270 [Gammaproteobacteria bacterium]|nr:MAG: hypothetical protein CM15mP22_1270 [Gammaproteobacteria bacterium]
MTISEQGKCLAEDFSFMEDWTEKYQYMIDLSKSLDKMNSKFKTDDNLIKGCQSKVWLHSSFDGKKDSFSS